MQFHLGQCQNQLIDFIQLNQAFANLTRLCTDEDVIRHQQSCERVHQPMDLAATPAWAGGLKEKETGVVFKDTLTVGGHTLKVAGAGVREKAWIDVYAGALYVDPAGAAAALAAFKGKSSQELAKDAAFFKALVKADFAKAMVLRMVRDVSADAMREALLDGVKPHMKPNADVNALLGQLVKNLDSGSKVTLLFSPNGSTQLLVGRHAGKPVKNRRLARALQKVWLGRKPISKSIKRGAAKRFPDFLK